MKLVLPNNNRLERRYAAEVLFKHVLKLELEITHADQDHSDIVLSNGKKICIEDHFFNRFPAEKSYLNITAIPSEVRFAKRSKIPYLSEEDLPIICGTEKFEITEFQVLVGIDVFAACFFCLTRWEEAVNRSRDLHGRFPATASLAYKFGYLNRPVVDEMAAFLYNLLAEMGELLPARPDSFEFWPTHDIDMLYLWSDWISLAKKTTGDLLKRLDLPSALYNLKSWWKTKVLGNLDPYDTFDYLMDLSDKYGFQSHFYFLAGGISKYDNQMEQGISSAQPIMAKIVARGHQIGVHPSYHSATNSTKFAQEIERFKKLSPLPVTHGRQHFLRFDPENTWQFWDENGLEVDSTMGYPEQSGFRCGTCTPFPVFDFTKRNQLRIMETPLIAMDATFVVYQKSSPANVEIELLDLLSKVKKYRGVFVFLWHNSSFNVPQYRDYAPIYERILAAAKTSS